MDYMEGFQKFVRDKDALVIVSEHLNDQKEPPQAPPGMRVLWDTLCGYHGWKLQKNYYFNYYRIVDENHRKRAWGTEREVMELLEKYA